ncbi:MAG: aldo/keto reductase [Clostridia bacterium]|nr:aldo/keto reductase [Clostridia bacterium]
MNTKVVKGKEISQITIGTVQLGMNYGIANNSGQPDSEKSRKMLQSALKNGITSFDTARAYGTAEDVLGEFLKTDGADSDLFITSKFIVGLPETSGRDEIEKAMFTSVETSLSKLGINRLNCLMLHRGEEITRYGKVVPDILEKMIAKGYIDMAGVSVYSGDEIDTMLCNDVFSATQIPMNIFDQNLIYQGYLDKLKEKNITVFVRSVFLQGLFFLNPEEFTDPLLIEYAKPYSEKLRDFCKRAKMSIAELAISFIRDVPGVTSLVLGADTEEQIVQNVSYINAPSLSAEMRSEISKAFQGVNMEKIMEILRKPKK